MFAAAPAASSAALEAKFNVAGLGGPGFCAAVFCWPDARVSMFDGSCAGRDGRSALVESACGLS